MIKAQVHSIRTMLIIVGIFTNFAQARTFKIGGIFDRPSSDDSSASSDDAVMQEQLFNIAVDSINADNEARNGKQSPFFSPSTNSIGKYGAIEAYGYVCQMLDDSVIAIFGPQSHETAPIVKSICDVKEIPHIQTRYDPQPKRNTCGINLYPHPATLSKAYRDMIRKLGWSSFMIIYEDNESLIRISELLQPTRNLSMEIKQLPQSHDYRSVFHRVIESEEVNILLDCSIETLPEVLKQAQQVGVMIKKYNYIVTCLDLHTIDLESYKYSGVNIYGFRLVNPCKADVSAILEKYEAKINDTNKIVVEAALMYDAVTLFGKILREKFFALPGTTTNETDSVSQFFTDETVPRCRDASSWKFGLSIINDIKVAEMRGLSGLIKFDYEGFRTNVELQIIKLTENGIREKGIWNSTHEEMITFNDDPIVNKTENLRNTTFRVIIPMTKPYGMRKKSAGQLSGNERFEGYAVDLVHQLSLLYDFKYEILVEEKGSNGMKKIDANGTVRWDGMMGAVLNKHADLAVGDLTISKERSQYVEFSLPLMDLGIAILYTKPRKEKPDLFSFLFPFSDGVWYLVITAGVSMALQLYIMARISPYEWRNPYPCNTNPEEFENQFTFANALWFTLGALMQQGSEVAPVSPSTRIAAGLWWFFTLIMVSSYTANLAAFLTVETESKPFSDAYALAKQKLGIHYGAKRTGTTLSFFKDSRIKEFRDIYDTMMRHPEDMTENNEEGVAKVLNSEDGRDGISKYAFFMESSGIDYEKEQHCNLSQIGPLLDSKTYGIAMRKGQWYNRHISEGVLFLQTRGTLRSLKRKWWKEKYSKNCQEDKKNEAIVLKLDNVGGVFLVLIAGIVLAFFVVTYEVVSNLRNRKKREKIHMRKELGRELKFILQRKNVKSTRTTDEKSLLGSQSEFNHSIPNGSRQDTDPSTAVNENGIKRER